MSYVYKGVVKNEPTIVPKNGVRRNKANGTRVPPCGTDGGYRRHWRNNERSCEDCLAAHAAATKRRLGRVVVQPHAKVAQCGTESGYKRHLRLKEVPCGACDLARLEADRRRKGSKPAPVVSCGTASGYSAHIRKRTPACEPCKAARAVHQRAWRANRKANQEGTIR